MTQVDLSFPCMGSPFRVLAEGPLDTEPEEAVVMARALLEGMDESLSRFLPGSELSALNRDPRTVVPASTGLRDAVRAALWAASRSGGLSDPTMVEALVRAGYGSSRAGMPPSAVDEVLAVAPTRQPARPDPVRRWQSVVVDDERGAIQRPSGVKLDLGGSAKGFGADRAASLLAGQARYAVDCAGDIRVGGLAALARPFEVLVEHPFDERSAARLILTGGAVATSGISRRAWITDGAASNHLLDPSTGAPAWTGLVQTTALAPTTLQAETLAKTAYLAGPRAARGLLAEHGGILVDEAGQVEIVPGQRVTPLAPQILRAA
jgi:thiamine biosynthesis lipoprotein